MTRPMPHRRTIAHAALVVLVFLLLANVSFKGMESLTTGRLAIMTMAVWAIVEGCNPLRLLASRTWLPYVTLLYVIAQFVVVGDSNQFSRLANMAVYSYLGAALFVSLARDARTVLWVLLGATTIQSAIILLSFVSLDYRAWFDATVTISANYDALYLYRAPGFSSDGGASLSVTQSLGAMAAWLLLRPNPRLPAVAGSPTYAVCLAGILAMVSCIVVGRTGLLLSLLFLALLLVESAVRWRLATLLALLALTTWLSAGAYLSNTLGDDFSLDYFSNWAFGVFTGSDDSIDALSEMRIPPLSLETIVGTGLSALIEGANPSGHDSGFVQTYYSMGLVFACMFFVAYLYVIFYCLRWLPFRWRLLLTVAFFALEVKEPFVFKYAVPFALLALNFVCGETAPRQPRLARLLHPS